MMQIKTQPQFGGSFLIGETHKPKKVHQALMAEECHRGYITIYTDDYQLMPRRMIIVPNRDVLATYDGYVARGLNQAGISYSFSSLGAEYWLEEMKKAQRVGSNSVAMGYPVDPARQAPVNSVSRFSFGGVFQALGRSIVSGFKKCWEPQSVKS